MKRIYLLLAVIAVGAVALSQDEEISANCPNDLPYTTAMKFFHGTCYQFVSQEKYWHQARDFCLLNGGRLVKVNDPQTNQFIVDSLNALWWRNQGVWIGLHDITAEMQWQWTGYELHTNEPLQWNNWGRGHPGAFLHGRRDCVRMVRGSGDWKWHETLCSTLRWHYRFICEYKANVSRSAASSNLQVFRRPNPVHHELPASDNSVLEGFSDEGHSWHSGEVHAVAENQSGEQKAVDGDEKYKRSGIIAVAIGCLLVGTLVIIIAFVIYRRRQRLRRYVEDDQSTFSKGKDPVDDDAMTEESKSARPKAVANIYVTADGKGHVTTRLTSRPQPDVILDSDSYEEEDYAEYDDGEEIRQESQVETPTKEELDEAPAEYDKPKSSNIYFEIPDNEDYPDNSHIYEALDEIKK